MTALLALYPTAGAITEEDAAYLSENCHLSGLRLVLADDYVLDSERQLFDEIVELPPPEEVSQVYDCLRGWCDKHHPDGIFIQSEAALPIGSLLAREFSLPGPSVEAAHLCINKYRSREALARSGVPTPAFRLAEGAEDVRRFAREAGYPVVLKAVASALSHLVRLVAREDEIDASVAFLQSELEECRYVRRLVGFARLGRLDTGCDPAKQFLVESFASGACVETDGLVDDGQTLSFGVTEQIPSSFPRFYIEGYLFPADLRLQELSEIHRVSDMALGALGLNNSGFSVEMRLRDGQASVIEVNGRLGWDDGFSEMFETRLGSRPGLLALQMALGRRITAVPNDSHFTALAYRNCYEECIVEKLPRGNDLAKLESAGLRYGLVAQEGTRFHAPPHIDVRPHVAWVLATHETSSRAAFVRARKHVSRLAISFRHI